jgi:hypothetical protein
MHARATRQNANIEQQFLWIAFDLLLGVLQHSRPVLDSGILERNRTLGSRSSFIKTPLLPGLHALHLYVAIVVLLERGDILRLRSRSSRKEDMGQKSRSNSETHTDRSENSCLWLYGVEYKL